MNSAADPGVAQLVARLLWEQDAAGSNPVTRTIKLKVRKAAQYKGFPGFVYRLSISVLSEIHPRFPPFVRILMWPDDHDHNHAFNAWL